MQIPAELKIAIPKKILGSLSNESFDLIYLLDIMKDSYEYISSTKKLLGYKRNLFYQKGSDFTLSLINPNDYQRVIFHFASVLKNSNTHDKLLSKDIQFRMKHLNGDWIWISRTAVTYKQGKTYKVLGLVKDCSTSIDGEKRLISNIEKGSKTLKILSESIASEPLGDFKLTNREMEVLKFICEGLSTKMIADKLKISKNTVDVHRKNLHKKMGVHNSSSLIRKISNK